MAPQALLRPLLELAAKEIPHLPAEQQVALYDAVFIAAATHDPEVSRAAHDAAKAIRATEAAQLTFSEMLKAR